MDAINSPSGRSPDSRSPSLLRSGRRLVRVLLCALALELPGCGDGGTGPGPERVGPEGGTVSLAGGALTLSVPADALSGYVELTAKPAGTVPPSELLVAGSAYEIGPAGTTFDRLVTLTLRYDPGGLPEGVRETELRLQKASGASWGISTNSTVDPGRQTVSGLIERLGSFAAVALPASGVELYPSSFTLSRGEMKQLLAVARGPSGEAFPGREVTWFSSDEIVATVDSSGLVTAMGGGSTTIRAATEGREALATIRVFDCSAQADVPAAECLALIAVYDGITLSEWRDSGGWIGGPAPCSWRGVTCEDGSVSELVLPLRQYPGSIPFGIGGLSNLTRLDLSANRLTGLIPSSLGALARLRFLSLSSNDLSGSIPSELGQLTNLEELDLYWNLLSGPIPTELGNLANLTDLRLNGNRLRGPIPAQLGNLSSLRTLSLFDNQLSGAIPPQLGSLAKLERLALFANELTGGIPRELGMLSSLTQLHLRDNLLSGPIPAEIGRLSALQSFYLEGNELAGPIPLAVAQLGGLIQSTYLRGDCRFAPPGNAGLTLPDTQEFRSADLDGDGMICGVAIGSDPAS